MQATTAVSSASVGHQTANMFSLVDKTILFPSGLCMNRQSLHAVKATNRGSQPYASTHGDVMTVTTALAV